MSSLKPAILLHCWASSASYRVRICLNYKKILFKQYAVDLQDVVEFNKSGRTNEQVEELRRANPMKYVPVLKIDGLNLIESTAIMEYLEERHPTKPLLPKDPLQRAQARAISSICVSGIQPLQNIGVISLLGREYTTKDKKLTWAQHWIRKGFTAIESYLQLTSGKFSVGDEISLADVCLIPQVFNAKKFNVDLTPYPTILRIDEELKHQEAFKKSHPFVQEDFPHEKYPNETFFNIYK